MAIFAKYDGIDGESKDANHGQWIDVISLDWGVRQADGANSRGNRRRGDAIAEDLFLAMDYDKASPKLQEKCLKGAVIPKLEIELTATYGGARATYLRYELKNVLIKSFHTETAEDPEAPPGVLVANNFESIKVTYSEFDETGSSRGNVETTHKVGKKSKK